jgi:hypothetical protein
VNVLTSPKPSTIFATLSFVGTIVGKLVLFFATSRVALAET